MKYNIFKYFLLIAMPWFMVSVYAQKTDSLSNKVIRQENKVDNNDLQNNDPSILQYSQAVNTDSLNIYLQIAAKNNPGLNADFLSYKASLEKLPQAGALPDSELEMGFFLTPMEIVGGKQIGDISLMQMFPWFGSRKAARTEASHMAQMSYERFRESRDNLYLEVYKQWYILCTFEQQLKFNRDNRLLLEQLKDLAIRKVSSPLSSSSGYSVPSPSPVTQKTSSASTSSGMSGMSGIGNNSSSSSASTSSMSNSSSGMGTNMGSTAPGMSDVLRIQMEIVEIDNNIESLQSALKAGKAQFNALLNREADSRVDVPESFSKLPFNFTSEIKSRDIESLNPMLGMLNEEALSYKAKGVMDKKMSYPMIGIGLQYMLIENNPASMDQGMNNMSPIDKIMPMVSISLPIFRNKYKAQQRESEYMWQSAREKYNNTLNSLRSDLFKLKHQLDDAERKITLYAKQEELAKTTYNLILQEFVTGRSDLANVIEVQRQLLDYRLKEVESVAEYNTMVASILKLVSFNAQKK
jgi:outer membrane protein TolC